VFGGLGIPGLISEFEVGGTGVRENAIILAKYL
jgi:hypothetical protein